ncbi:FKBP-type peptidyl-prolyl cis-trans isomerase [Crocinitomicaceae bacterium]|nr:FKBP-type peptidyl-prolyl cis-trans isomerase [Crocinitomicaceae bacterium]
MKYVLMMALFSLTLVACGNEEKEKKKEEKPVELKTDKDKWSYYMGYQAGNSLMSPQNPNKSQFAQNKAKFIEGYKNGFRAISNDEKAECYKSIQGMMGGSQDGSTFDASKANEGCNCIGILTANDAYTRFEPFGPTKFVNLGKMEAGFVDGVNEKAKRVSDEDFQGLQASFNAEAERLRTENMASKEVEFKPRWDEIKAIEGIQELDKGIYLETIKNGTGGKPVIGEDVQASYVLRQFDGNVKETSEKLPDGKFQANLAIGSLIEGWVIGFQSMEVGGKYRLYVPSASAYGVEPLDFEIEFFKKGPGGTLAPPRR